MMLVRLRIKVELTTNNETLSKAKRILQEKVKDTNLTA